MRIIDIQSGREGRSQRLSLLRHFNVAGKQGEDNWHSFIRLALRTGFQNDDFRNRLGMSEFQVRLWENHAKIPSESQREHSKRVIVGTLYDRFGFPMPDIRP